MKYVVNYKLDKAAKKSLEKKAEKARPKSDKAKRLGDDSDNVEFDTAADAQAFYTETKKFAVPANGFCNLHECHHDEGRCCRMLDAAGR